MKPKTLFSVLGILILFTLALVACSTIANLNPFSSTATPTPIVDIIQVTETPTPAVAVVVPPVLADVTAAPLEPPASATPDDITPTESVSGAVQPPPTSAPEPGPARSSDVIVTAAQTGIAPVIDGNLNEWGTLTLLANTVVFQRSNWVNSVDHSARFGLAWDNNALYLAVRVQDDVYVQTQRGQLMFMGDSVELLLDADLAGDRSNTNLNEDDHQLGLSAGSPQPGSLPEAFLWFPWYKSGTLAQVQVAAQPTATGYQLEAAIPWSVFGIVPQVGNQYGFGFSVSDNDTPGTAEQQSMISIINTRRLGNPGTWGTLQLEGGGSGSIVVQPQITGDDAVQSADLTGSSSGQPLRFSGWRLLEERLDSSTSNNAITTVALDFIGGVGPYTLTLGGISTLITKSYAEGEMNTIEFHAITLCGAGLVQAAIFTATGSNEAFSESLFIQPIACNPPESTSDSGSLTFGVIRLIGRRLETSGSGLVTARIALDFTGGVGPYTLKQGGISTTFSGPVTSNAIHTIEFDSTTLCGGQLAQSIELTATGNGESFKISLFMGPIECSDL